MGYWDASFIDRFLVAFHGRDISEDLDECLSFHCSRFLKGCS